MKCCIPVSPHNLDDCLIFEMFGNGRDLVTDFITEEYRVSVRRVLNNALRGEECANFEFPFYTKDQRRVDVLLNATTRRDAHGRVLGVNNFTCCKHSGI